MDCWCGTNTKRNHRYTHRHTHTRTQSPTKCCPNRECRAHFSLSAFYTIFEFLFFFFWLQWPNGSCPSTSASAISGFSFGLPAHIHNAMLAKHRNTATQCKKLEKGSLYQWSNLYGSACAGARMCQSECIRCAFPPNPPPH